MGAYFAIRYELTNEHNDIHNAVLPPWFGSDQVNISKVLGVRRTLEDINHINCVNNWMQRSKHINNLKTQI